MHECAWTLTSSCPAAANTRCRCATYVSEAHGLVWMIDFSFGRIPGVCSSGSTCGARKYKSPALVVAWKTVAPFFVRSFMCHAPMCPSSVQLTFDL